MKRNDQKRKEEMYHLLCNWGKSGMNQKEFCQKNGVSYSVFKYWNKKRKHEGKIQGASKKNQQPSLPTQNEDKFVPLRIGPKPASSGLCILYPNGVQVNCPEEIGLEQFKRLIQIY